MAKQDKPGITFEQLCAERKQNLEKGVILDGLSENYLMIVQALIKMLTSFESTDLDRLVEETRCARDELENLISGIKFQTDDGNEVNAFQIRDIRGIIKGIYLTSECAKNL